MTARRPGALVNFASLTSPPAIYRYTGNDLNSAGSWQGDVTTNFNSGDSESNYGDCIANGRTLLGTQADQTVTWIAGGPLACLDGVLASAANANGDGLPAGSVLIQKKVAQVFVSAGLWPSNDKAYQQGAEYNFDTTSKAMTVANDVFANWPSPGPPILIYGVDQTLPIGAGTAPATGTPSMAACATSMTNPYAYVLYDQIGATNPCLHPAFTQPVFLFLTQGFGSTFRPGGIGGTGSVNSGNGYNAWSFTAGPASWLQANVSTAAMQAALLSAEGW
jgi:hypothetical protein